MNATALLILVVIVAAAAVAIWLWTQRKRRSEQLREHFGPEYEHALHEHGSRGDAEHGLAARKERFDQLNIRPLTPEQSSRFAEEWRSVQAQFVDDPENAIAEA